MASGFKSIKYTKDEEQFLIDNYPIIGNKKCAELMGRSRSAVNKKAKKMGLNIDRIYKYISVQGYVVDCTVRTKKFQVHRKIVEQHIGRKLTTDEIVHHIDGNKTNNTIENLQVMTRSEHINLHRDDLNAGKY